MSASTTTPTPLPGDNFDDWRARLDYVVDMMREMSRITDPQATVRAYRARMERLRPNDGFVAISRRDIEPPKYRITRTSLWKEDINPWLEVEKLPILQGGLLGEMLYSNVPHIIDDLQISPNDPAYDYFKGQRSLIAMPTYDQGVAMNMTVMMRKVPRGFDPELLPDFVWQSSLFGRFTQNLVLSEKLGAAYAEVERELDAVAQIQRSLLPVTLPQIPGVDVAAHYHTSRQAGGDYYDFFALPNGRWGIFVADVSGHGTPAAVVMAVTHTIAHSFPGPPAPPNEVLAFLNRKLMEPYTTGSGTFVTAFYAVYDPATRRLSYASAGHNPPRLRRKGATTVEAIDDAQRLPLGIDADETYVNQTVVLAPGDEVVFYTDGITEAWNGPHTMWGTEGLDAAILRTSGNARESLNQLLAERGVFVGNTPAADDQTLLVMRLE